MNAALPSSPTPENEADALPVSVLGAPFIGTRLKKETIEALGTNMEYLRAGRNLAGKTKPSMYKLPNLTLTKLPYLALLTGAPDIRHKALLRHLLPESTTDEEVTSLHDYSLVIPLLNLMIIFLFLDTNISQCSMRYGRD